MSGIAGILTIMQYVIVFFIFYNPAGCWALRVFGWFIWVISLVFGILPIFILRRKGGVPKGKSYIETTVFVDSELYAIIRHPQYLGWIMFNISMAMVAQNWLVWTLGVVSIGLVYATILDSDYQALEKFGEAYRCYMQRVPRINLLLGVIRLIRGSRGG